MGKTIKHIKITSFILIVLQIVLVVVYALFYYFNWFDVQYNEIFVHSLIPGVAVLIFLDSLFVWIVSLRISHLRKRTDLHAAEVIGSDVQEAYNFAEIGLVVTDDNDVVLWTNDLFKNRHIDIIDQHILSWKPDLANLKNANTPDTTCKLSINNRDYEVKYLADAGLWIFKDDTEYESIYKFSKEQAPVVGVLAIDNYDDVIKGEDDFNDIVTKVKSVIFQYAKEYGILLRRVKDDNYSMLCNFSNFSRMKEDKFSIIDKVREVSHGEDIPLTLSIGLAYDFPDVIKLNELATSALDIAMSRGGDQVAVSPYGQEMEYFGGKSEAQEKRNRVKIRVLADSLNSLIKSASNVLIMGHTNMDMDAFGACLGVKAICERLNVPSLVVVDLKATEYKTRSAIAATFPREEYDKIAINPNKITSDLIKTDTLLVVCDVHIPNMVMAPNLLDKISKIVVIDHHRRGEEYIENPVFNHIDASASSACELVAEFIHFASITPRINMPSTYATFMLSGILLDTSYFKSRSTGMRTFEACTILKEFGADNAIADDYLKDDFEEHQTINNIISNLEHPTYGVVVACANENTIFDSATISKAANTCLSFKGIHASFVLGKTGNNEIKLSARSDGTINVQLIAEALGGGGHFSMSAAVFNKMSMAQVHEKLVNAIENNINERTSHNINLNNL